DNYKAAYTYGLERIKVQEMDDTRPESQDPLYYLYDGLGSVRQLIRPNAAVRDHYNYDEFGVPAPGAKLSEDGRNVNHNTFGYTGELWDEEDDLLYLRSRYYAPWTGRFLTEDRFGGFKQNPLSLHKYLYVANDPINNTDPLGLWLSGVHFTDTYLWAIDEGFSLEDAEIIADYDDYVDENPDTGPMPWEDQSWHFDRSRVDNNLSTEDTRLVHFEEQLSLAYSYLEQGNREQALRSLGTALHPLQDIDAHMRQGINNEGGIYEPHDDLSNNGKYDDTNWDFRNGQWVQVENEEDNSRWTSTRDATKVYLRLFYNYEQSLMTSNNKKKGKFN
ncbi:MAG: RHS repeat-associated core domain-containing protein, partial [Eubacteriales bacterium]